MLSKISPTVVKCFVLLIFTFSYLKYYETAEPYATGDGIEYILTTEAWFNHGTPNIKESDYQSFKRDFIKHQSWHTNYKAGAFDEVGRFLNENKSIDTHSTTAKPRARKEFGGFYRNEEGHVYGYHFVFYSLVNVPARLFTSAFNIHPIHTFFYTHLLAWLFFISLLMFQKKTVWIESICLFLGVFFSGAFYYAMWTHPELITVVLLSSSLVFLRQNKPHFALLLCALSTLQNQPILFLLLWMFFYIWRQQKFKIRSVLIYFPYLLIVFLPSIYFYFLFGTTNLIKDAGFLSFDNLSFNRVLGFFFDWNQGMVLGLGLFLFLYMFLLLQRAYKLYVTKTFDAWDLLPFIVLCMTLLVATMNNWNHGMAIINRYAVWISIPVYFHVLHLILQQRKYLVKTTLLLLGFASQLALLWVHLPYNQFDWSNLNHMPIAKWFLENHSAYYNPDPQIFIARTNQVFDFTEKSSPVFYFNHKNRVTKIAVHANNLDTLKTFGYVNKKKPVNKVFSGKEAWYYVNDFHDNSPLTGKDVLALIKEGEIKRILFDMNSNQRWMNELKIKAETNNCTIDKQMQDDANYLFQKRHPLFTQ